MVSGTAKFGFCIGLFVLSMPAFGHARLRLDKSLKPRTNATGEKTAPCGSAPPTTDPTKRTVLTAGTDLVVEWEETINHPGWYRIAFSPDGLTGYDANVLKDNIPDIQTGATPHLYSTTIKVPATPCENCSIQMIQVMTENPASPSNYYSCSDIRIVASGTATPSPTPTSTPSASPSPMASANPGDVTPPATNAGGKPAVPKGLKIEVQPSIEKASGK